MIFVWLNVYWISDKSGAFKFYRFHDTEEKVKMFVYILICILHIIYLHSILYFLYREIQTVIFFFCQVKYCFLNS